MENPVAGFDMFVAENSVGFAVEGVGSRVRSGRRGSAIGVVGRKSRIGTEFARASGSIGSVVGSRVCGSEGLGRIDFEVGSMSTGFAREADPRVGRTRRRVVGWSLGAPLFRCG